MKAFDFIWAMVFVVASWFFVPWLVLGVVNKPHDYWSWVSLVIWVSIMIAEYTSLITSGHTRTIVKDALDERGYRR